MKTIWKFELTPHRLQSLSLPAGAQMLHVATKEDNAPLLWVLVDPEMPLQEQFLGVYTTNTAMPDNLGPYIGTFQIFQGSLEFHVFALDQAPETLPEEGVSAATKVV